MRETIRHGDVGEAAQWSAAVLGTGLERTPNHTGFAVPDRFLIGYLGELATAQWLDRIGAYYRHNVDLRGRTAAPEFVVELDGAPAYLEVKTAGRDKWRRLFVPTAQRLDAHVYVAACVVNRAPWQVELVGWLPRDDVATLPLQTFPQGCPARAADYGALHRLDALAARLGRRRVVKKP